MIEHVHRGGCVISSVSTIAHVDEFRRDRIVNGDRGVFISALRSLIVAHVAVVNTRDRRGARHQRPRVVGLYVTGLIICIDQKATIILLSHLIVLV